MRNSALILIIFGAIIFSLFAAFSNSANANSLQNNAISSTALYVPKASPVIETGLLNLPSEQKVKIWIFFTDKGIYNSSELNGALDEARNMLTERALARRAKTRGENRVDFRDIPINDEYVHEVVSTGATVIHRSKWFNGISALATAPEFRKIASLPFVRRIEKVKALGSSLDEIQLQRGGGDVIANPFYSLNYGPSASQLMQINVPPAHELGFDGSGIIVCMLDVGFKKGHQAFASIIDDNRLLAEWDFINNDGNTDLEAGDPPSQADHGTLTWSTLGGQADGHLYGPAYKSMFILGKTEDVSSERHIEEDNWAAGAEWADSIGAEVISASLGYRWFDSGQGDYDYSDLDGNTTIVTIAADLAAYNGIAVCTAMGNDGYSGAGSLIAPADADSVISCGATDFDGNIASFSSLGPTYDDRTKPEVIARGVGTDCADPDNLSGYTQASGTSLSTPLIGGAAAVILSAHPNWDPMQVREALMMTADKSDIPDNTYGWGMTNASKAIFYNPEGSINFDFAPLYYAMPAAVIPISATITCSQGINASSVKLYWNDNGSDNYSAITMTKNGDSYACTIPSHTLDDTIYYYIYAERSNGLSEVYPIGAPRNRFITQVSLPQFQDNLENGPYCWAIGGTKPDWGISATYTNSGNLSLSDSPQGKYRNNADNWMVLKRPLSFATADNPELSFYHRYDLQNNSDFVYIEGSTDGGSNWTQIGQPITGTQNTFIQASYLLDDFSGSNEFLLRFRLSSNSSTVRDGWFVDDIAINWSVTGVEGEDNPAVPGIFSLDGNYPNPFNAGTIISFQTPRMGNVTLDLFNMAGQKIRTLHSGDLAAGSHQISWDGISNGGVQTSSGVYFARLRFMEESRVLKMTLIK